MGLSRVMRLTSRDVFTNLAAEERLFQYGPQRSLLFYVNRECAVLGRTQNPFKEVDVAYAAEQNIAIARRRSGGGTVVHDEGNLNFCFVRPRHLHDPHENAKLVAAVLRDEFGIKAVVNHRADILVDGMKVSGAAYRISRDRAYHHGTLLINSDLDRLRRVLKSPLSSSLTALGTASVSSPVTNLREHSSCPIDAISVIEAVAERFSPRNPQVQPLSAAAVELKCSGVQDERAELSSSAWVYGQIPKFVYSATDADGVRLDIGARKGAIVESVSITEAEKNPSRVRSPVFDSQLQDSLLGEPFDGRRLSKKVDVNTRSANTEGKSAAISSLSQRLAVEIPEQFWIPRPSS